MHMRQAVAYKRLKLMENYKTVRPKKWAQSLTRGGRTWSQLHNWEKTPLSPPLEKHIGCSICCLVIYSYMHEASQSSLPA